MGNNKIITVDLLAYFKEKLDISIDNKITAAAPYRGENGCWIINGIDTGIPVILKENDFSWGELGQ